MGEIDLKALQQRTVKDIQEALPSLDRDQVTELLALEADCGQPRETLTKALATRLEQIDADDAGNPPPAPPAAPAKPAEPDVNDFRHPDYRGALTCEQADWRNLNLKPGRVQHHK